MSTPRILHFDRAYRPRRPLAPTQHTLQGLVNDLQILALEYPDMLAWLAVLARRAVERRVQRRPQAQ